MRAFVLCDPDDPCLSTAMRTMGLIQVCTSQKQAEELRRLCCEKARGLVIMPVDLYEHGDELQEQLEKEVEE